MADINYKKLSQMGERVAVPTAEDQVWFWVVDQTEADPAYKNKYMDYVNVVKDIGTSQIKYGAITGPKLAADCVDGSKVKDEAIDSEHIKAGAIDLAHLAVDFLLPYSKIAGINTDPNADRIIFFDNSADSLKYLTLGTGLSIVDTTLNININEPGLETDDWTYDTDTWEQSPLGFQISGKDVRYKFPKGTKIKLIQNGEIKYFNVKYASFNDSNTFIEIIINSDYRISADYEISGQAYSYAETPQGFPQWFNYPLSNQTGWTEIPTGIYRFYVCGNTCFCNINVTAGTSNNGETKLDLPIVSANNQNFGGINFLAVDNGNTLTSASKWFVEKLSGGVRFYKDMGTTDFTASGTKLVQALVIYEF